MDNHKLPYCLDLGNIIKELKLIYKNQKDPTYIILSSNEIIKLRNRLQKLREKMEDLINSNSNLLNKKIIFTSKDNQRKIRKNNRTSTNWKKITERKRRKKVSVYPHLIKIIKRLDIKLRPHVNKRSSYIIKKQFMTHPINIKFTLLNFDKIIENLKTIRKIINHHLLFCIYELPYMEMSMSNIQNIRPIKNCVI